RPRRLPPGGVRPMERNAARQPDLDERRVADVAVRYAEHGWPVVPLHSPREAGCSCGQRTCGSPGKHPRTRRGLHEASPDLDQIRAWWGRWPDANRRLRR
ncbi:MAG: bifunctional DNA primase/polymerase, partial [Actinomycetota bacterium]|nr:bifunctional DNA primase/polymerase [Actinomycetota bacterium]